MHTVPCLCSHISIASCVLQCGFKDNLFEERVEKGEGIRDIRKKVKEPSAWHFWNSAWLFENSVCPNEITEKVASNA